MIIFNPQARRFSVTNSLPFKQENDIPILLNFSGGRTSGTMAIITSMLNKGNPNVYFTFQNTGYEAEQTLKFVNDVDLFIQQNGHRVSWLEYRPPIQCGDRPMNSQVEQVTYATASRDGRPFKELLLALEAYRKEVKGEGPTLPNVRKRICTAHLKVKVAVKFYSEKLECWDNFVGLRADEPSRVSGLMKASTARIVQKCPLAETGIVKEDILKFWNNMPFDLLLEEKLGNCILCFMKDESHIASNAEQYPQFMNDMIEIEQHTGLTMLSNYRSFQNFNEEYEMRQRIRLTVKMGLPLPRVYETNRRAYNIYNQEVKEAKTGGSHFSCECDGSWLEVKREEEGEERD